MKTGRPEENGKRRKYYIEKFGIKYAPDTNLRERLPARLLDQLDRCPSDLARKVLLGVRN